MKVPVQYYQEVKHFKELNNGHQYVFTVRAQICLAYVDEADVQELLDAVGGCCGKKQRNIYVRPNEDTVRRWTNGGGA